MKRKTLNLAMVHGDRLPTRRSPRTERHRTIIDILQTTLEAEELIRLFCDRLQASLPHDGYCFKNERLDLEITDGYRANHSCSYQLATAQEPLGELKLMRRTRFSADELAELEDVLALLIYPLRNALLYLQALRAAHTDPLTGVHNRNALGVSLQREWQLARRHGTPLAVIFLDADHFKSINDALGHATGDEVLRAIAECMKRTARASDMVFRYGGEEFVVLMSNTTGQGAVRLAERIRSAIAHLGTTFADKAWTLTASLGVASLKADETRENLLRRADEAMYRAKRQGRNRVVADLAE